VFVLVELAILAVVNNEDDIESFLVALPDNG